MDWGDWSTLSAVQRYIDATVQCSTAAVDFFSHLLRVPVALATTTTRC